MNSIKLILTATEIDRVGSEDDILYTSNYYFLELKTSRLIKKR